MSYLLALSGYRHSGGLIGRLLYPLTAFRHRARRIALRRELMSFEERMLRDMGIARYEIDAVVAWLPS